jgi:hypothetical protein
LRYAYEHRDQIWVMTGWVVNRALQAAGATAMVMTGTSVIWVNIEHYASGQIPDGEDRKVWSAASFFHELAHVGENWSWNMFPDLAGDEEDFARASSSLYQQFLLDAKEEPCDDPW